LIVDPEPAEAPVIAPTLVPNVHAKVLGTLAVRLMFVPVPLQILAVVAVDTPGTGYAFIVIEVLCTVVGVAQGELLTIVQVKKSLVI